MTHEELRALALAATPGPWSFAEIDPLDKEWGACEIIEGDGAFVSTHVDGKENAAYIAAASPDAVLGLLDSIRRADELEAQQSENILHQAGEIARLLDELKTAHMDGYEGGKQEARDAAQEEIERLRGLLRGWLDKCNYEDRTSLYRRTEEILK